MDIITNEADSNILERIEQVSNLAKYSGKKEGARNYDNLLDLLDNLIQLSADRFMTLGDSNIEDSENEAYQQYVIHPTDIIKAKGYAGGLLLKIISTEILFNDDKDDERMERASRLLAHMSGRGELLVPLHEPCYVGNDLGFKTWGAAPMMAKKLLQEKIISNLNSSVVLELGTGTGMVGLICDHLGAAEIHVTDYHPRVLENVAYNVELNKSKAIVSKLDFIEVANDQSPEWKDKKFDIIIASDLLYEMEHAEHLPIAVEKLMKNDFYFMIPLRYTHMEEVQHFEMKMMSLGLVCRRTEDSEREEEEGLVQFRYYEYTRA
ncbi:putative methyltransferase-domain-containing protein [Thamnidium elegans]|nr:putative methyltransferase-domain-containing protein [Thamnidium elegans]